MIDCVHAQYDKDEGYEALNQQMLAWESGGCSREPAGNTASFGAPRRMGPKDSEPASAGSDNQSSGHAECTVTAARLLYLALPADVYPQVIHPSDRVGRGIIHSSSVGDGQV